MFDLYYYLPWPESQKWLDDQDAIDNALVVPNDDGCFVEKQYFEDNECIT